MNRRAERAHRLRDIAQVLFLEGRYHRGRRALFLALVHEQGVSKDVLERARKRGRRAAAEAKLAEREIPQHAAAELGDVVLVPGVDTAYEAGV